MNENDFTSAGYIGMPSFIFDFLQRALSPQWLILISNWWSWALMACVIYGVWTVYCGMQDKVRVLGGGVNKWSAEAGKWKWVIFRGFLFIHANYLLVAFVKGIYAIFVEPAGAATAASFN